MSKNIFKSGGGGCQFYDVSNHRLPHSKPKRVRKAKTTVNKKSFEVNFFPLMNLLCIPIALTSLPLFFKFLCCIFIFLNSFNIKEKHCG